MSWSGIRDRRRHRRSAVRIQSEFGDADGPGRIETVDLSAGGFSCRVNHEIDPLTRLAIRFDFPAFADEAGRAVQCDAIVVRCEKRFGVEGEWLMAAAFTGLSPGDREFIDRYVDWHETVNRAWEESEEDARAT
ncbi:MAG: hypothetical protein GF346_08085 [Candidatus Eisenbacteria bacterium]|nr:hypothetical protein [Candidatus Latescibacterota bacterium]MBD3302392.1 hypothetical protein [Candidatus Eisenbacteria bacterium]